MTPPNIVNITQAAERCGIPKRTFFRMLDDGRCPVRPIPHTKPRRWLADHLDDWIAGTYDASNPRAAS